ncbi:MAG: zinc-ribbon domain-containing protein [Carboxydocellales bacterium]
MSEEYVCPKCGTKLSKYSIRCHMCGRPKGDEVTENVGKVSESR